MFEYKYLTDDHLKGFDKYKYSSVDTSPLSQYVMHPFWNTIVKFTPSFIAPNLLTFAGFLCVVVQVLLFSWYDYWYTSPGAIPQWVFTAQAILFFFAYTLDGIDGKQARKLGVSGPLGELFDHGLDSWIVFFEPFCLISICGVVGDHTISPMRLYLIVLGIVVNWNASHVEKYNTGVLFLPWGYDVAMWSTTILFLITGIVGVEATRISILGFTSVNIAEVVIHCSGLMTTVPLSIYNVYMSYKNRTGKMRSLPEALRPLWSLVIMCTVFTYWFCKSPGHILEYDLRMCLMLVGTLFSNVANRLIVSQMSGQRCELVPWLVWLLVAAAALSFFLPILEYVTLCAVTVFTVIAHVHYGVCVVKQMCKYYRISCFSVKRDKKMS